MVGFTIPISETCGEEEHNEGMYSDLEREGKVSYLTIGYRVLSATFILFLCLGVVQLKNTPIRPTINARDIATPEMISGLYHRSNDSLGNSTVRDLVGTALEYQVGYVLQFGIVAYTKGEEFEIVAKCKENPIKMCLCGGGCGVQAIRSALMTEAFGKKCVCNYRSYGVKKCSNTMRLWQVHMRC